MFERKHKHKNLKRVARVGAALLCGLVAFQLGGCVLERLNTEAKNRVNAKVDEFIAGDEMTIDQRLVAQAVGAMNGGAYYEAEALLDSAVQINPSNHVALLNLGAVYEATGRPEKAVQVYGQLSDPVVRPVTGAGLANNDIARLAATRLALLRAGMATPAMRQAVWQNAQPANVANQGPNLARFETMTKMAAVSAKPAETTETTKKAATSKKAKAAETSKTAKAVKNGTKKTAKADDKKAAQPKQVLVTLSNHPNEAAAKSGWDALAKENGAIIGKLAPTIKPIRQEGGKPDVYRLTTGPFGSAREAAAFCDKLLAHRVYCVISG